MNASALRRVVEEDGEPVSIALPLSGFDRPHSITAQNRRFHPVGVGLALGVHALMIIGFLVGGTSVVRQMPAELTVVSILPEQTQKVDLPTPPKLQPVVQPQVEMPEFVVDTPPPQNTITVSPATPVVRAAAPSVADNSSYFSKLLAHLYSYKRYPEAARLKREKGIAVIRIVMLRNGTVTGVTLVKSSGSDALDQEALALPMRAQPMPPMPDSMPQQQLTMNVNVDFTRVN